ncbi:hypothetical protein N7523_010142 [Penicillium sp. IBT 18751x]|nr:hypothetical protein N7523_010142 [Penicillium sp. IBT 18751x]
MAPDSLVQKYVLLYNMVSDALWAQSQESVSITDRLQWSAMRRDSQQPLGPTTPPADAPHSAAEGHIEYPRMPTIPASSTAPSLRRSGRVPRAPVRYEP